jgi:class 3 adenylate cyclase
MRGMEPQIRFVNTPKGTRVAYSTVGEGPLLVTTPGSWESMRFVLEEVGGPFYEPLAMRFQVARYDRSGTGMSDRNRQEFSVETDVADIESLADALGRPFALMGSFHLGPAAILFAVRHPDKVTHLVLYDTYARGSDLTRESVRDSLVSMVRSHWGMGSRMLADVTTPGVTGDIVEHIAKDERESTNGETVARLIEGAYDTDVTGALAEISIPTLVIHRRGDRAVPFRMSRDLTAALPDARLVALEGAIHWPWFGDSEAVVRAVVDFVSGGESKVLSPRASAFRTVLFTDLVGHTEMMSRLGDERGREVLREHERTTREVLKANGGTEVKTMGDGFMASFGSVTKAVECAVLLQRAFAEREGEPLSVRIGLNAGEPIEEEGDLFGATVILASRIAAKAEGGEILVSDNVRSLCSGKGFLFADRGEFVAKGFEEALRVYEVSWRD